MSCDGPAAIVLGYVAAEDARRVSGDMKQFKSRTEQASLQWLTDYFGSGQPWKDSALKIIRDKTAFHYDKLNLTEAADNLAAAENSIYLA